MSYVTCAINKIGEATSRCANIIEKIIIQNKAYIAVFRWKADEMRKINLFTIFAIDERIAIKMDGSEPKKYSLN